MKLYDELVWRGLIKDISSEELIDKFYAINDNGYVKGINNNVINSAGLTFEHLLSKKADSKKIMKFLKIFSSLLWYLSFPMPKFIYKFHF